MIGLLPNPGGPRFGSPPAVAFVGSASDAGNAFSYTFTAQAIGVASADRLVVVCARINALSTEAYSISSISIGGLAATMAVRSSANHNCAIAYLLVPAGTTANIVVALSGGGTPGRCAIDVFTVKGYRNAAPIIVNSAFSDTAVASLTTSVALPTGACAIACAYTNAAVTHAWDYPLAEVSDFLVESTGFSAAMANNLAMGTLAARVVPSASTSTHLSLACWR